ncbi:acyl-homoserine-lactone synthase [Pseudomonas akapageensis]|uniref:acyl-homoserine-lactone synthase n=1 Tax=Pseudomonas akapageensis TaxID=2609961 RepID=UPI00140A817B|nr:acyl-homoserine-lactone synthase [Pseudomonas akapageensis]
MHFEIGKRDCFKNSTLFAMHKLRADVFKARKGWDIPLIGEMEIDGYDALNPFYMLIQGSEDDVQGCWRILPTTGPYMLKDTFPMLLNGRHAPEADDVWELSRFAIDARQKGSMKFSDFSLEAIKAIVAFGVQNRIRSYVTVTTVAIERMLRRAGLQINRFGPPVEIGVETAVALEIDLGITTQNALFGSERESVRTVVLSRLSVPEQHWRSGV